jgi:hypothetical protein
LSIEKYSISSLLLIIDIFPCHLPAGTENGADKLVTGSTNTPKKGTAPQKFQVQVTGLIGILTIFIFPASL